MVFHRRTFRRICAVSIAAAAGLYVASPYAALWSMGRALAQHDDAELRSVLDWGQVRDGFKQSMGLSAPVQPVSQQQDELPGFGESFASRVASGTIDAEITPQSLDAMLSTPLLRHPASGGLPHGGFHGPAGFEAEITLRDEPPIEISMHIEQWRWKVTHIVVPQDWLRPPSQTAGARHSGNTRT